MKKSNIVYLQHMLVAINRVESYLQGKTYEDFSQNDLLQDAVIRQLELMGEAASKVSKSYKEVNRQMPWAEIKAARNKLIHEYFDLDYEIIWNTTQKELPDFKAKLLHMIRQDGVHVDEDGAIEL